ncbi:MAG: hybrid sensor histidine kinase/response regulator [Cyanobacteriota bacterium]|nr:hybrid sensor histidine kinase/response regulator [Cyanobacteriota bacterium]
MTTTSSSEFILVVDDTPANLKVMVETLTNEGYEVTTAISGERALKQISYELPELILLDIQMPGIDGFETCKKLKENPETKDIPIIFMTALADTESIVKGFSLGAVDYITKPFQVAEVIARVKTHINLQHLRKNLEQKVVKKTDELNQILNELKSFQLKLIQSEKMSALGELIAGIAHELNNPIGSIYSNTTHLENYIQDITHHLSLYQKYYSHPISEIIEDAEKIDLDFIIYDLPKMVTSMKAASERITYLSTSLRTFSRIELSNKKKVTFHIHKSIDSTLLILNHRLKANQYRSLIKVVKKYGYIPHIECFPGQLGQVFMNIISNAIDAINELNRQREFYQLKVAPQILIHTAINENQTAVVVRIKDNGVGMSEEVKAKIFDSHFTTKPVGDGTGLGLCIAHQIIVENHGGKLWCESTLGQGSEFILELPLKK